VDIGDIVAEKFEIRRVLEVGGRSTVFEAYELDTDRFVVVELFPRFRLPHEHERFLRELRGVAALQSAHVARVLASGSQPDGSNFVVSEPPEGESLDTLLRRQGPLPLVRVVELILQVCDALHEAHAAHIIHGDLSPETIFLTWRADGSSWVKIRDFCVRLATHAITEGRMFAAPRYTAPEQLSPSTYVDERTDIWALGAIMYELSSGQRPLAQAPAELDTALLTSDTIPLRERRPGLPSLFSDAVMCCLASSPGARYESVLEVAEAIGPFAPGRGHGVASAGRGVLVASATRLKSSTDIVRQIVRHRKP
jgi:eukaryotic-like serine/threonine-protein kinase